MRGAGRATHGSVDKIAGYMKDISRELGFDPDHAHQFRVLGGEFDEDHAAIMIMVDFNNSGRIARAK